MRTFETLPALKFALLFSAGILSGSVFFISPFYSLPFIILLIIISIFLFFKKTDDKLFLFPLALLIFTSGFVKANFDFYISPGNSIKYFRDTEKEREYKLIGVITESPVQDSARIRFIIEAEKISFNDTDYNVSGNVAVYLHPDTKLDEMKLPPYLKYGDRISMYGRLSVPFAQKNPGSFDYRKYLEIYNIYKVFFIKGYDNIEIISSSNLPFIYQKIIFPAREFSNKNIDRMIGGDEGAFLKGLVTGDRSGITKQMKEKFVNAGVMHLIAVSGLNVAYVILFATILFSIVRFNYTAKFIGVSILLCFYVLFTGNPASIIRAGLMGILFMLAFVIQRKHIFYNLASFSAILILMFDSKYIYDGGFILSYSAVFSIALFYKKFDDSLLKKIEKKNFKGKNILLSLLIIIFTTLAAQIGTLPIISAYFGKISLISYITNLFVIPLSNISLIIGFLQVITAGYSDFIAFLFANTNTLLLSIQLKIIDYTSSFEYAFFYFKFTLIYTIIYFSVVFILFSRKMTILFRIFLSSVIIILTVLFSQNDNTNLKVAFLDVGQGDCSVITTPGKYNIVTDIGPKSRTGSGAEYVLIPYLRYSNAREIDLLILTHLHNDHISGLDYILPRIKIKKVIIPNSNDSKQKRFIVKLLDDFNVPYETVTAGSEIILSDSTKLFFLYPPDVNFEGEETEHISNLVMKVVYRNLDILYTADSDVDVESVLNHYYKDFLKSDILKIPHHGSKSSSSVSFLINVLPEVSVISCGANNRFNHPSVYVLNRLEKIKSRIFRTDKDGAVIFESDGNILKKIY